MRSARSYLMRNNTLFHIANIFSHLDKIYGFRHERTRHCLPQVLEKALSNTTCFNFKTILCLPIVTNRGVLCTQFRVSNRLYFHTWTKYMAFGMREQGIVYLKYWRKHYPIQHVLISKRFCVYPSLLIGECCVHSFASLTGYIFTLGQNIWLSA